MEETGVTVTFDGLWRILWESLTISGGIVAEKKSDCLFTGRTLRSFFTSWIKPISSIRSASSKTKISISWREIYFWFMRSRRRPGVAMIISTPFLRASTWRHCPTHPKITVCLSERYRPYASKLSPIWIASSRVGVTMSARVFRRFSFTWVLARSCKIGNENAAVFPVPVWAHPRRSTPFKIIGIDSAWIGVGDVYHSSWSAFNIGSISLSDWNDMGKKWKYISRIYSMYETGSILILARKRNEYAFLKITTPNAIKALKLNALIMKNLKYFIKSSCTDTSVFEEVCRFKNLDTRFWARKFFIASCLDEGYRTIEPIESLILFEERIYSSDFHFLRNAFLSFSISRNTFLIVSEGEIRIEFDFDSHNWKRYNEYYYISLRTQLFWGREF